MESSSSDLSSSTQPPSLPNFLCKVCLRSFHSERGLLLHRKTISKYNRPTEHIDIQERVKTSKTNPLVVLANQRAFGKKNIKRKSCYKRGEVIIEWRERKDHEINDNFCYAGHITMNFYISQIRSLN
ncbi:unnamed protein product [Rhizophagus irregularis]|uniref:C2H2-type domain-containing protein n=1 Tax=Rhizophagus irregularis TaxID=588596 RepID=A0A916DXQ9_9GLOM|nr:unnamed protein product [Rhizophagus irregularis]